MSGVIKIKGSKNGENWRAIHLNAIVKDVVMLVIVSNLLTLLIESRVNQNYKLMEASCNSCQRKVNVIIEHDLHYIQQSIGNIKYWESGQ